MKIDPGPSHSPWASWSTCPPPPLSDCCKILEHCLESMAEKAVRAGSISSQQIFTTLNKWHGLTTALRQVLQSKSRASDRASPAVLWDRAVLAMSGQCTGAEVGRILGFGEKKNGLSFEEASYIKESIAALKLAKKVIELQQGWRANAISHMNQTGVFSRTLTHSCTDWPCLLLELLSQAAEIDHFQVHYWFVLQSTQFNQGFKLHHGFHSLHFGQSWLVYSQLQLWFWTIIINLELN